MKGFKTILFDDKEYETKIHQKEIDFFKDLNLDTIIDDIVSSEENYDLKPFFYTPLRDEELVKFRLEIFKDLQRDEVFRLFKDFEELFNRIKHYLSSCTKLSNRYRKMGLFRVAVSEYTENLSKFYTILEDIDINSKGLNDFKIYLKEYISSQNFSKLSKEALYLKKKFQNISYVLKIQDGCIELIDKKRTQNLDNEVEKLFYRFTKYKNEENLSTFEYSKSIDDVREHILKMVVKKYQDEFNLLEKFYTNYQDFIDHTIKRFNKELRFYTSYLKFIKNMGYKYFSYPTISRSKQIKISDFFDIAIFLKLKEQGKVPIFNDFNLSDNQKGVIITGANQGGKTTFARALGVVFYLSSLGCLVPAKKAELFLQNGIYTHFEREENISNLQSKLEEELVRLKIILDSIDSRSFVIINEIFSSTTLEDANKLAKKMIEKFLERGCLFVVITFLQNLSRYNNDIITLVAKTNEKNNKQTYKIVKQIDDGRAYAKNIAKKYSLRYEDIASRVK